MGIFHVNNIALIISSCLSQLIDLSFIILILFIVFSVSLSVVMLFILLLNVRLLLFPFRKRYFLLAPERDSDGKEEKGSWQQYDD
jgi:hypothetical protein